MRSAELDHLLNQISTSELIDTEGSWCPEEANVNFFTEKIKASIEAKGDRLKLLIFDADSMNGIDNCFILRCTFTFRNKQKLERDAG